MIERRLGQNVTQETKAETFQRTHVDRLVRRQQILHILEDKGPMTAKQIAIEMHHRGYTNNDDRNNSSPRLTELMELGLVEPAGKTICIYTGKTVAVFKRRMVNQQLSLI